MPCPITEAFMAESRRETARSPKRLVLWAFAALLVALTSCDAAASSCELNVEASATQRGAEQICIEEAMSVALLQTGSVLPKLSPAKPASADADESQEITGLLAALGHSRVPLNSPGAAGRVADEKWILYPEETKPEPSNSWKLEHVHADTEEGRDAGLDFWVVERLNEDKAPVRYVLQRETQETNLPVAAASVRSVPADLEQTGGLALEGRTTAAPHGHPATSQEAMETSAITEGPAIAYAHEAPASYSHEEAGRAEVNAAPTSPAGTSTTSQGPTSTSAAPPLPPRSTSAAPRQTPTLPPKPSTTGATSSPSTTRRVVRTTASTLVTTSTTAAAATTRTAPATKASTPPPTTTSAAGTTTEDPLALRVKQLEAQLAAADQRAAAEHQQLQAVLASTTTSTAGTTTQDPLEKQNEQLQAELAAADHRAAEEHQELEVLASTTTTTAGTTIEDPLEKKNKQLEAELAAADSQAAEAQQKLQEEKTNVKEADQQVTDLENEVASLTSTTAEAAATTAATITEEGRPSLAPAMRTTEPPPAFQTKPQDQRREAEDQEIEEALKAWAAEHAQHTSTSATPTQAPTTPPRTTPRPTEAPTLPPGTTARQTEAVTTPPPTTAPRTTPTTTLRTTTTSSSTTTTTEVHFPTDGLVSWFKSENAAPSWKSEVGDFTATVVKGAVNLEEGSGNGADGTVRYLVGDHTSMYNFGHVLAPTFSLCSISRYAGPARGRVLTSETGNFLHGHYFNQVGVVYYEGWETRNVQDTGDLNWAVVCATNGANLVLFNGQNVGLAHTNQGGDRGITINYGPRSNGQTSDWAVAELMTWDRVLSQEEMRKAYNYLVDKLKGGTVDTDVQDSESLLSLKDVERLARVEKFLGLNVGAEEKASLYRRLANIEHFLGFSPAEQKAFSLALAQQAP